MRAILLVLAVSLSMPMVTQAQVKPEIRPFVGAFIPTGNQRDVLDDALFTGAQLAVEVADVLHLVGTFAFAGPDFKKELTGGGHMHIYQSDVGAELFRVVTLKNDRSVRPFLGAGLGVRTYDPTATWESRSYPAGYGTVGAELQFNRVAVRFEARDYLTRFKGVAGNEEASTRNELALSVGLAYHLR